MADMKAGYEEILARRKGQPPLPTAVVYPCSEDALMGASEAANAGLIAPLLVGPPEQIRETAEKAKLDISAYENILIAPNIEAGNMMYKELTFMAGGQAAGLVMSARVPVILTSRADTPQARLFSCALAVLLAEATAKDPSLLHAALGE